MCIVGQAMGGRAVAFAGVTGLQFTGVCANHAGTLGLSWAGDSVRPVERNFQKKANHFEQKISYLVATRLPVYGLISGMPGDEETELYQTGISEFPEFPRT